jgi:hypothetical protein
MSGMHSDNYELARSSAPQSIKDYSAFTDKQWNYKTDSNGGVYQTQNASVEFDLSSIYQSDGYTDVSDMYIVLPLVMVAASTNAAGTTFYTPPTAGYSLCSLKNNFQNLIHSMELVLNGKTIHDHQSFLNVYSNFKMLSSMSPSDLKSNNTNFGMASELDSHRSMRFGATAPADASTTGGYGIFNNTPVQTAASILQTVKQNNGKGNDALLQRINRIADTTANSSFNNLFGTSRIMSLDNLKTELKPFYTVSGNYMYWFDYGIINLKYIIDAIAKIGLVKKADMRLRMYVNVGAVQITINSPVVAATTYKSFTTSFSNTCPFTVNHITGDAAAGGFSDAAATLLTAGIYLSKPPSSFSGGGTSVAITTQVNSPMSACQLYYSNVKLDLTSESEYINANRAKQIIYEKIYFASVSNIANGNIVDKTITASITNPIGLVIVPFVSKSGAVGSLSAGALGFAQYESPWDTAPSTSAPISLTNLSVSLGGKKVANEVLNYTYENFLHQVSLAETIASSDIGLNVGLVNQEYWETNRVYYMDLARSREVDKDTPRELTFKCTNNSLVPIDVLIFAVYLEKFSIDVVTGAIVS